MSNLSDIKEVLVLLIKNKCGIEEGDDEFHEIEQSALNKLLQTRYECFDKNQVKSKALEFVEKFKILGYPQKAENLQQLLEMYEVREHSEDDIKWGKLLFLMMRSSKPTASLTDDERLNVNFETSSSKTSFDWAAYLKEGLPKPALPQSDTELSSEGENTDKESSKVSSLEENVSKLNSFVVTIKQKHGLSGQKSDLNLSHTRIEGFDEGTSSSKTVDSVELQEAAKEALIAGEQLKKEMWWTNPDFSEATDPSSPNVKILSEYKVMLEIVWAFDTPSNYFILHKSENGYKPREGISLTSCCEFGFYNEVLYMCSYLSMKEHLDSFVRNISEHYCTSLQLPDTYIAYSRALDKILVHFRCDLHKIESQIMKQDDINTITTLKSKLNPWFQVLNFLYEIHQKAVMDDWKRRDNWECSIRLLVVLCENLKHYEGWNKTLLMILFIKTLNPYFDIIERWLMNRNKFDTKNEFLIIRPSKNVGEENLIIRDYHDVLNAVGFADSLFIQNLIYYSYRACSSVDFLIILQRCVSNSEGCENSLYDEFLVSVLNSVKSLGVKFTDNIDCRCGEFVNWTYHLNHKKSESRPTVNNCFERTSNESSGWLCRDPTSDLLDAVLCSFRKPRDVFDLPANDRLFLEMEYYNMDQVNVEKLLTENFSGLMSKWMQPKGFAKEILLVDYDLLGHLMALKMVFLLQEGVMMNYFLTSLFTTEGLTDNKWLFISWTTKLRDFICEKIPSYSSNFSVVFDSELEVYSKSFLTRLNRLSIKYQRSPPLNLVITNSVIEKYNELFQFLIKLKWAYYCIKHINIKSLIGSSAHITGKFYSIRMFLFHNILILCKYFFSLMSNESYDKIIHLCSIARDIQVIKSALERILDDLRKNCFLTDAVCHKNSLKIFDLCEEFKNLWKAQEENVLLPTLLDSFETRYQETIYKLADGLLLLDSDPTFHKSSHFKNLSEELLNNMPGDWDSNAS